MKRKSMFRQFFHKRMLVAGYMLIPMVTILQLKVSAATIHVPDDFAVIQDAVNFSGNGDLILISPGTYTGDGNRNIDFLGKKIILLAPEGPDSVIIDCNHESGGLIFHTAEDRNTIVSGLTIRNGSSDYGGGASLLGASPSIFDCRFIECSAVHDGGGIDIRNHSDALVTGCTAESCSAGFGAGIAVYKSDPVIGRCTLINNTAASFGGGIYFYYSGTILTSSLVAGNQASSGGGVRCSSYGTPFIRNCTITDNSATVSGGGLQGATHSACFNAVNCIVWDNSPDNVSDFSGSSVIEYSDIQEGWPGEGNFDSDPLFLDDFRISENSPCVDSGTGTGGYPDLDGLLRPRGIGVDIGANEFDNGGLDIYDAVFPEILVPGEEYIIIFTIGNSGPENIFIDSIKYRILFQNGKKYNSSINRSEPLEIDSGTSYNQKITFTLPEETPSGFCYVITRIESDTLTRGFLSAALKVTD